MFSSDQLRALENAVGHGAKAGQFPAPYGGICLRIQAYYKQEVGAETIVDQRSPKVVWFSIAKNLARTVANEIVSIKLNEASWE